MPSVWDILPTSSYIESNGIIRWHQLNLNAHAEVATSKAEREGFLKVFPNPATDEINIQYADFQNKHIIITDVLGRTQKTLSLQSETTTINIQNFSNGIYYVSMYENNRLLGSRKFVVLHE